jgi:hypothetical protein
VIRGIGPAYAKKLLGMGVLPPCATENRAGSVNWHGRTPTVAPIRAAPSLIFSLRSDQTRLRANTQPLRLAENTAKPSTDQPFLPHSIMPSHHDVRSSDVIARRLHGNLAAAADRGPNDFPDLLLTPGIGARTVRALAMVRD